MDIMRKKRKERTQEIEDLKQIAIGTIGIDRHEINIKQRAIDALSAYGTHEAIGAIRDIIVHQDTPTIVKEYGLECIREIRFLNIPT
jgi:hypothetical protein